MGDCWDYRIKKVEIAWCLARPYIERQAQEGTRTLTSGGYHDSVKEELQRAWNIVNDVLPSHTDPTKE